MSFFVRVFRRGLPTKVLKFKSRGGKRWKTDQFGKPDDISQKATSSSATWTPTTALALGAALSFAFTAGKAYQNAKQLNSDYSRDDKFKPPQYGSKTDMEKVVNI